MNVGSGPEDDELAHRLRLTVSRLYRRMQTEQADPPPPLQMATLAMIDRHAGLRVSDLARAEAVSVPTMSRVLSTLCRAGLVVRAPDQTDGRSSLFSLSDQGRARLWRMRAEQTALVARRIAGLDDAQRAVLTAALPALEALLAGGGRPTSWPTDTAGAGVPGQM